MFSIDTKKYKRVQKKKEENNIKNNEIRITSSGQTRNYITYATSLFEEKNNDTIFII
jgi:hypothetical protein